ncbi:MAG: hypothetical protein RIR33_1486 [Pseudomonadota bacterium]
MRRDQDAAQGGRRWSRRSLAQRAVVAACTAECNLAEGETGRIARILGTDSLVVDTWLRMRLAVVGHAATGYDGRAGEPRTGSGSCARWAGARPAAASRPRIAGA